MREQGSEAWQRVRERRPARLREGERRMGNTEGTKRGQERASVERSRTGKENTTERVRETDREKGWKRREERRDDRWKEQIRACYFVH